MNDEKLSNGANGASGDWLKLMSDLEHENDRDIYTAGLADGLSRRDEVYEQGNYAQLDRLTPEIYSRMEPIRKRLMHDFAAKKVAEWNAKCAWMLPSLREIEVPEVYKL